MDTNHTTKHPVPLWRWRDNVGSRKRLSTRSLSLTLVLLASLVLTPQATQLANAESSEGDALVPEVATLNNWTNLYPDLFDIHVVAPNDVWASGHFGELLHYTGRTWRTASVSGMETQALYDVSMQAANSGWIAAGYKAYQYNGSTWVERSAGLGFSLGSVYSIAAVGPNEAWATGYIPSRQAVLHWNGSQWTPAGPTLPTSSFMNAIAMSGPNEGWAHGQFLQNGTYYGLLYRYNGSTWQQISNPTGSSTIRGIYTSAGTPGQVWLTAGDYQTPGRVYHYNNGSWSVSYTPSNTVPGSIYMAGANQGWTTIVQPFAGILRWNGTSWSVEHQSEFYLDSVSGVGTSVWASGNSGTVLNRTRNGTWARSTGSPTNEQLYDVDTLSPTDARAVGANGTILHYTGSTWVKANTGVTNDLYDVQMLASNDGYAVGANAIMRWNGSNWTRVATPPANLRGVSMTSPGEGWAVGSTGSGSSSRGSYWRASGGQWSEVTTNITHTLEAVAMDSPSHGWAVGSNFIGYEFEPALVEYVNGSWVDRTSTLPADAPSLIDIVLAPGGQEGWAVGQRSANNGTSILHLVNGTWQLESYNGNASLAGVDMMGTSEVWAVGNQAAKYSNGTWSQVYLPMSSQGPVGISLIPNFGGWAVGSSGTILRYRPTP